MFNVRDQGWLVGILYLSQSQKRNDANLVIQSELRGCRSPSNCSCFLNFGRSDRICKWRRCTCPFPYHRRHPCRNRFHSSAIAPTIAGRSIFAAATDTTVCPRRPRCVPYHRSRSPSLTRSPPPSWHRTSLARTSPVP